MSSGLTDAYDLDEYYFDDEDLLDEEDEDEDLIDDAEYADDIGDLSEALRGVLHEDYAGAAPEDLDEALYNMLEPLSPAESFNLTKALSQIEKGATQALGSPVAQQGLPILGSAVGTYFGGPAGTAIGGGLGTAAAKALTTNKKPAAAPKAGGSIPAAQGLLLTQSSQVLPHLVAAALGAQGRQSINGVPVGAVLSMLSTLFGQAAADADELMYASNGFDGEAELRMDPASPADRAQALYTAFIDAENEDLADEVGP
jgi:hypothetical protein